MNLIDQPSPNFDERANPDEIDMLVLHYTGMENVGAALTKLCDPAAKVSAHYLIDEDGTVYCLVDGAKRAWHAGVSWWRGHTDINARSIGVELVNPGHEFGYRPFPESQMNALIGLARQLTDRYLIPEENIVGHSDVAPTRKQDPGELFDWPLLAKNGIGYWPEKFKGIPPLGMSATMLLSEIGYDISDPDAAIRAFQRRYCPNAMDSKADGDTLAALYTLYLQQAV